MANFPKPKGIIIVYNDIIIIIIAIIILLNDNRVFCEDTFELWSNILFPSAAAPTV